MKKLLPIIIIFALCAISCKKTKIQPLEDPTVPAPQAKGKNKISGTITPAGSVAEIKLVSQSGGNYLAFSAIPDDQGRYTFADMEEGDYMMSLTTTYGFLVPANVRFTMARSADVTLANIDVQAVRPLGTSSISGKLFPSDAAYSVTLAGSKSSVMVTVDPTTGVFKAVLLPEDSYIATFQTNGKYLSPKLAAVLTQPGKAIDMGTLSFATNMLVSSMSATVGNNDATFRTFLNTAANMGSITAAQNGTVLSVQGIRTTGSLGTAEGGSVTRLGFTLGSFSGIGTYICDRTGQNTVSYYYRNTRLSMAPAIDCRSDIDDAKATVTVTAYDPVKKTISGTVSGTLKGTSALTGGYITQALTNGRFDITL